MKSWEFLLEKVGKKGKIEKMGIMTCFSPSPTELIYLPGENHGVKDGISRSQNVNKSVKKAT
jgi:hypothetical protein